MKYGIFVRSGIIYVRRSKVMWVCFLLKSVVFKGNMMVKYLLIVINIKFKIEIICDIFLKYILSL